MTATQALNSNKREQVGIGVTSLLKYGYSHFWALWPFLDTYVTPHLCSFAYVE